jgi:hypothetical protein
MLASKVTDSLFQGCCELVQCRREREKKTDEDRLKAGDKSKRKRKKYLK